MGEGLETQCSGFFHFKVVDFGLALGEKNILGLSREKKDSLFLLPFKKNLETALLMFETHQPIGGFKIRNQIAFIDSNGPTLLLFFYDPGIISGSGNVCFDKTIYNFSIP